MKRRHFIRSTWTLGMAAAALPAMAFNDRPSFNYPGNQRELSDEDFWDSIRRAFTSSPTVLNLNNGGVCPQPIPVLEMQEYFIRKANELPSYYLFNIFAGERESVRIKLANLAGTDPEEICMNRNSSEGLETVILGLNLKAGDEILTTNQDYPNMMNAWRQREKRDGIKVNKISIPVPCEDYAEIVERFKKAITPRTKVILCCHIINLTGQILPVREICDMAHEKGIEVIVDGAHSFAHLDFKVPDLHCDYFATSLHKWLSAPFGTGMLYIQKNKIKNIWPLLGSPEETPETDIRKFESLGTRSFAAELAIAESIRFYHGIGAVRKQERLRFLKNYWATALSENKKVKLNTSLDARFSCALGNFGVEGMEPGELHNKLWSQYKIYTTPIVHPEFKGNRITPNVYTSIQDLDYFIAAVRKIIS